jgi:hypothetical protein
VAAIGESAASGERRAFTLAELLAFARDRALLRFLAATFAFFILQVQLLPDGLHLRGRRAELDRAEVSTLFTLNGALVGACCSCRPSTTSTGWARAGRSIAGTLGYAVSYAAVGPRRRPADPARLHRRRHLAEILTSPAQQAAITALAPPAGPARTPGLYGLCQVAGPVLRSPDRHHAAESLPPRAAWSVSGCSACWPASDIGN